jgi:CHASE1-domain containing sensor protein
MIKDPTALHAQKRSKNMTMLAVLIGLIVLLFAATIVRIMINV